MQAKMLSVVGMKEVSWILLGLFFVQTTERAKVKGQESKISKPL